MNELKLNGIEVKRVGVTIFIPLPKELWRSCNGCSCGKCDGIGYWDTLAVATNPQGMGRDTTWTVHHPELHAATYAEMKAANKRCPQCIGEDKHCTYCSGTGKVTKSSKAEWMRQNA